MTIHRMDQIGLVVKDLAAAVEFFLELGLELEGKTTVQGEWADKLLGIDGLRSDVAVVRTSDGHCRIELSTFTAPATATTSTAPWAPIDTPGVLRLTFVVDDLEDVLGRLRARGAEPIGEVARVGDYCLYVYLRGPDGVMIGLVEEL